MSQWFRVFGAADVVIVDPAALLEHLRREGFPVAGHFHGDDLGWFRAELVYAEDAPPVVLERYLTKEDGIRAELNAWAAWLETAEDNPHHADLMARMIGTAQLFTLNQPVEDADDFDEAGAVEVLSLACCRYLALATDGVYQADHRGFFSAGGDLLVRE